MASSDRFREAEDQMLRILEQAGLDRPDVINHREEYEELELIWHERRLVVIVELDR